MRFVHECYEKNNPAFIIGAPKADLKWRLDQILQNDPLPISTEVLYITESEVEDIYDKLQGIKLQEKKAYVFTGSSVFIDTKNIGILNRLIDLQKHHDQYRFYFLFETDVTDPMITKNLNSDFLKSVFYYPLFDEVDSAQFVHYLAQKWNAALPEKIVKSLVRWCGGHTWLLKHAARVVLEERSINLARLAEMPQVQMRIESIYYSLSEVQQQVLFDIVEKNPIKDPLKIHALHHFTALGAVREHLISIELLLHYIKNLAPKASIQISGRSIVCNNVNITTSLSKKEKRILETLLMYKSDVVDRDTLAKIIWPIDTEEHYSDWAIDRLIARLRKKLSTLGLDSEAIQTTRNKGYSYIE
ncbi:helix-turn-helix domain-containing protein [Candidatus Roizmanbacteria bacterium]|nr:helix-turn-helix domain-containing protein [Candidatus Roizmanbacteria bacterium]